MLNRHEGGSEAGSLVIAVSVMLIVSVLAIGVMARTVASQKQVRTNQDFNAGLAAADAGLADALFQLDQDKSGSGWGKNDLVVGNSRYTYRVTQGTVPGGAADPNTYVIRSSGVTNGVRHDVLAKAKRKQVFDFMFFALDSLQLNGSCVSPPAPDPFGPVGSSGQVGTSTNCTPSTFCFLRPSGLAAAPSNGCGDSNGSGNYAGAANPYGQRVNDKNAKPPVTALPEADDPGWFPMSPACPWAGTISGTVTGGTDAQGRKGYYHCSTGHFNLGTLSVVNGPVRIYLTAGATMDFASAAKVNSVGNPRPPAVNLQVFVTSASTMNFGGNGSDASIGLYAPESSVTFAPNADKFTGSIIAKTIIVNGAPNIPVDDLSLQHVTLESWKVADYKEVPSSCPMTSTTC